MKHIADLVPRGFFFLILGAIVLVFLFALQSIASTSLNQVPTASTASESFTASSGTSPSPEPGDNILTELAPLPPTPEAIETGYPGPTQSPLPTATATVAPPILPTYPPPGPFAGMRLLYTRLDPPGYFHISSDGEDEVQVKPWWQSAIHGGWAEGSIRVSPVGEAILFSFWNNQSVTDPTSNSIWITDGTGENPRLLVAGEKDWLPQDPIWSPDGKQIAYIRACLEQSGIAIAKTYEIWLMDGNGGNQRLVANGPELYLDTFGGSALAFRWLRNGYIYIVNHAKQLYAVNPQDGALYQLLQDVDAAALSLALSPTGKYAVVSPSLPAEKLQQAGIVPIELPGTLIAWSGDESFLTYGVAETTEAKTPGIWKLDLLSRAEEQIVAEFPTIKAGLSPDGELYLFQTQEGIYIKKPGEEQAALIVTDPGDSATRDASINFVAWLPIR